MKRKTFVYLAGATLLICQAYTKEDAAEKLGLDPSGAVLESIHSFTSIKFV